MAEFPQMFRVRQTFPRPRVADIPGTVAAEMARLNLAERIKPGQSVAVTAGSRGIAHIKEIIRAVVEALRGAGAEPFIVPAMGSHGGGTAEGQRGIVEGYGMTEEYLGCRIKASMETVIITETAEGIPVHFDRHAYEADHVFVVGRVKPHTDFAGDIESGLMKMMLIGLGKHAGAKIYHRAIMDYSFGQIVRSVASVVLTKCKVVGGLGIVENGYDETALLRAVAPEEFEDREKELLVQAKEWMPSLPFPRADVLIIEEIGKNISGAGMDTNVIGRKFNDREAIDNEFPKIRRIVVRGLTPETKGNAAGIGIAEFCHRRVIDQMNYEITKINCVTGGHPSGAMHPTHYDTDREILENALSTIGLVAPPDARVMRIRNTLQLAELECSVAYLDEARAHERLEILSDPYDMPLGADGNLEPFEFDAVGV
ncbi:MAG: lactate racemase domain-containing protein [Pirellulales bacterium]